MKKSLKVFSVFIVAIVLFVLFGKGNVSNQNNENTNKENVNDAYRVVVDIKDKGIHITYEQVKNHMHAAEAFGRSISLDIAARELAGKELMLWEANLKGIEVSKEMVLEYMEEIKNNLPNNKVAYHQYQKVIDELGLSEQTYWEESYELYKKAYIINVYVEKYIEPKFEEVNKDKEGQIYLEALAKYIKAYEMGLVEKYAVSIDNVD